MAKSILWLDDEADTIKGLVVAFERVGLDIVVVASLQDAVASLKSRSFDLFLLDMNMPPEPLFTEMETMGGSRTGAFFAQYVRLHFPELPVVIFSAYPIGVYDDHLMFRHGIQVFSKSRFRGSRMTELLDEIPELAPEPAALDMFELKPGAFGLKLDVRKFVKYLLSASKK